MKIVDKRIVPVCFGEGLEVGDVFEVLGRDGVYLKIDDGDSINAIELRQCEKCILDEKTAVRKVNAQLVII